MSRGFEEDQPDTTALIVMCMHCRKTRRLSPEGEYWELVEEHLVNRPRNVSDGLCKECLEGYYPAK